MTGLSIGTLLRYAPFFFYGDYGALTVHYQNWLFIGGTLIGCLLYYQLLWRAQVSD
jgi:type VI protein secretion system component VasK